jgi:hypothetical protein
MTFDAPTKEHIKKMVCSVHDVHPIIEEDWNGIKVTCCCKPFERECLLTAENLMLKAELNKKSVSE